jgi:hypothetical protein
VTQKFSVGQDVDLHHAFRAVSIDVITEYGFNKCYDLLDEPDLGRHFFLMVRGIGPSLWVYQQWPELQIANNLPTSVLKKMSPELAQVLTLQEVQKAISRSLLGDTALLTSVFLACERADRKSQKRPGCRHDQVEFSANHISWYPDAESRGRLYRTNSRRNQGRSIWNSCGCCRYNG